jgi:hypothetical protein
MKPTVCSEKLQFNDFEGTKDLVLSSRGFAIAVASTNKLTTEQLEIKFFIT